MFQFSQFLWEFSYSSLHLVVNTFNTYNFLIKSMSCIWIVAVESLLMHPLDFVKSDWIFRTTCDAWFHVTLLEWWRWQRNELGWLVGEHKQKVIVANDAWLRTLVRKLFPFLSSIARCRWQRKEPLWVVGAHKHRAIFQRNYKAIILQINGLRC